MCNANLFKAVCIGTNSLRLGACRLSIETGRWTIIFEEERLCPYKADIQSEPHAPHTM